MTATVYSVSDDGVVVQESGGGFLIVPLREWRVQRMTGGDAPAVIGMEVEVEVIVPSTPRGDKAVASRRRAVFSRRWSMIELACSRGETVKGIVVGQPADGYLLDGGLLAQAKHVFALRSAVATGAFDVVEASSRPAATK